MYHFIGIKGSGMSALSIVMKKLGYIVQGSDYKKHFFTEKGLKENKIKVLPFNKKNIKENMKIIIGNSFDDRNIEVEEAKKLNLEIYTYQEMIGKIIKNYNTICVSGCHGKTTTSKMLSLLLEPNYIIGDGSGEYNGSTYFVLESCEYKRHFLNYFGKYGIITNIDLDHVDYYKSIEDVIDAYQSFIGNMSTVVACGDDENVLKLKHKNIYLYGINNNNQVKAKNICYKTSGTSFDVIINNELYDHYEMPIYGRHMVLNVLAVITIGYLEKIEKTKIKAKLKEFKPAKRRFNESVIEDNIIIDDYAHHPTEIESLIDAVKQKYCNKNIVAIFEPHTFSRVKEFGEKIAEKLNKFDTSYVLDIYPSRETEEEYPDINSNTIINKLENGEYIQNLDTSKLLRYNNSVLVFMSPNDLTKFIEKYKEDYSKLTEKK